MMTPRSVLFAACMALTPLALLAPRVARADESMPPDIVRTKDGGMYRGVIVQMTPGDSVTIRLSTGETRTFPMSDTTYAGPDKDSGGHAAAPETTSPAVIVHGEHAHLRLESSVPKLTFHLQTGEATVHGWAGGRSYIGVGRTFERLCTAPCSVDVPEGAQTFAISRADEGRPLVGDPIDVRGDMTLQGSITNRPGLRAGGITLAVLGPLSGIGMMVGGFALLTSDGSDSVVPEIALLVGGVVVLAGTLTGGIIMAVAAGDRARIEVVPGVALKTPPPFMGVAVEGSYAPAGATLVTRF